MEEKEAKAATGPFPITDEEKKLQAETNRLIELVAEMQKSRSKNLRGLVRAGINLMHLSNYLIASDIDLVKRQYLVAAILYNYDFKYKPFRMVKSKRDSCWDQLRAILGEERRAQVDRVYQALKTYVEPVSLAFISAK